MFRINTIHHDDIKPLLNGDGTPVRFRGIEGTPLYVWDKMGSIIREAIDARDITLALMQIDSVPCTYEPIVADPTVAAQLLNRQVNLPPTHFLNEHGELETRYDEAKRDETTLLDRVNTGQLDKGCQATQERNSALTERAAKLSPELAAERKAVLARQHKPALQRIGQKG